MKDTIELDTHSTRCIWWQENLFNAIEQNDLEICRTQIELIIIPDRYQLDEEVLQTLQARHVVHRQKNRLAIVFSASDIVNVLEKNQLSTKFLENVYKISTIRHGFITEYEDENKNIILALAKLCVQNPNSILSEITLRCCFGAGSLHQGLVDAAQNKLIGHLGDGYSLSENDEFKVREYLYGNISGDEIKKISIRTQTINVKLATLENREVPNVLFDFRMALDAEPELKHLHVKSYFGRVNPVPEESPIRLGIWFSRDRPPSLSHPKSVRLLGEPKDSIVAKATFF
ncbi:MAG: hypothetical protein EBQ95_05335 [Gammaproteobacteria bacterium]|nr:hypothetical protein [Gammaproteobacteria bacterium]